MPVSYAYLHISPPLKWWLKIGTQLQPPKCISRYTPHHGKEQPVLQVCFLLILIQFIWCCDTAIVCYSDFTFFQPQQPVTRTKNVSQNSLQSHGVISIIKTGSCQYLVDINYQNILLSISIIAIFAYQYLLINALSGSGLSMILQITSLSLETGSK